LTSVLAAAPGGWNTVFLLAASLNIVAAVMALAVLKPMRRRTMAVAKLGDRPELASRVGGIDGPST
jgi:OFA family oxalate/formate antiporter-like MFS transporter